MWKKKTYSSTAKTHFALIAGMHYANGLPVCWLKGILVVNQYYVLNIRYYLRKLNWQFHQSCIFSWYFHNRIVTLLKSQLSQNYYETLGISFFQKGIIYFEVFRQKERNYADIASQQVLFFTIKNNKVLKWISNLSLKMLTFGMKECPLFHTT